MGKSYRIRIIRLAIFRRTVMSPPLVTRTALITLVWLSCLMVISGCTGGGVGGGITPTPTPTPTPTSAISYQTTQDQGKISASNPSNPSNFTISTFKIAEPAQTQVKTDSAPSVVEDHGNVLMLNITAWPTDWNIGCIVAVKMTSGMVEYKHLLLKIQLPDNRLAIGVAPASLLDVINNGQISIQGDLKDIARSSATTSTAKTVSVVDYQNSQTITLLNKTDIPIDIPNVQGIDLKVKKLSLTATPNITIKLNIKASDTPLDNLEGWAKQVSQGISDFLEANKSALSLESNGQYIKADLDKAQNVLNGILQIKQVADNLQAMTQALGDKSRILEATALITGDFSGKVVLAAHAEMEKKTDPPLKQWLATVLVPIGGPVPIFLQFDLYATGDLEFKGVVNLETGAEVKVPFSFGVKMIKGQFVEVDKPPSPTFTLIPPTFDGTKAELTISAGVQCEAGISLATILKAHVDPKVELVFDTSAAVTGDTNSGCVELGYTIYGHAAATLTAELDLKLETWQYSWAIPFEFKTDPPLASASWQSCWGNNITPTPTPTPQPGGDTITIDCGNGVTMTLIKIPAGSFMMGTNSTDYSWLSSSRPVHQVTISQAFYMGKYEVTQAQYQAVMGTNPSYFQDPNKPVEQVSWNDAVAFCQALAAKSGHTIRLPSEAEWEYACKADEGNVDTKYYFGDDDSQLGTYAWYYSNSGNTTHAVGTRTANSFGLYDMSGNVWEWCQDVWHSDYSGTGRPDDGSAWTTGGDQGNRVFRGGAWSHDGIDYVCRSANRNGSAPSLTCNYVGFRVVSGNEVPAPTPTTTPTPTPTPEPSQIDVDCGNGVTMTLVKIPAGSFIMGTKNYTDYLTTYSHPDHQVTISQAFYMGKYEVTQEQYQAVMGTNPSKFTGDVKRPVEQIPWNSAVVFCQALATKSGRTIRLPSEAEWEYACKADKGNVDTKYYFGDDDSQLGIYAWYSSNSENTTHAVGTRTGNSFGLFDMSGNVFEWCQDVWHGDYSGAPTDGSAWMIGGDQGDHVLRGGSFYYSSYCRSSDRADGSPFVSLDDGRGFRVVSGN